MRIQILMLGFLMLLATQGTATPRLEPIVNEVPFSVHNGLVIVEAKIKDNIPVRVTLATGAEHSIMDPALLEKYKLSASYAADGPVTGRNDKTYTFTAVNGVRVGESKSRDLNMRFGSMASLSKMVGEEIFAALGADFFEGQIVQLDFNKKVIRFLDKTPPELIGSDDPNATSGRIVLRIAPKPDDSFRKSFLVPLVKGVQFNGQKGNLLLDTGVATSIAFSSSVAKKMGLTVPTENGRMEKIIVSFESQQLTDVPAWVYAKGSSADEMLAKYGAVAGSLFLQDFVVLFDYKKALVILERP